MAQTVLQQVLILSATMMLGFLLGKLGKVDRKGADPRDGGLFKVTVQQSIEKFAVFNYPKK